MKSLKLLRFHDLKALGIVSNRVTLSRWQKLWGFPKAVQLGLGSVAYPEDEVRAWLETRQRRTPHITIPGEPRTFEQLAPGQAPVKLRRPYTKAKPVAVKSARKPARELVDG